MQEPPLQLVSRRQMLNSTAIGFGGLALRGMLADECRADSKPASPLAPRTPHFVARAKRVIFLFMHGGPSHVDLFDPKPRLARDNGKPLPFKGSRVRFAKRGNLMQSPWQFKQHGQSGIPMSQLWQHLPTVADDLCMMHSVCETNVSHGGACMKIHTGEEALVRPSMGAWVSYGLGTENQDLPSFLTICPTSLHGGVNNFGTAFLPAVHQGVPLGSPGYPNTLAKNAKFDFMTNPRATSQQQRLQLELLKKLHIRQQRTSGPDTELDARIQSFELAFRMQSTAPEAMDVSKESKTTRALYGLDDKTTANFGLECLLARRFAERGVRFIQVSHAHSLPFNNEQWDQHTHLKRGHTINVSQIDKPITGLIKDLKSRGLLDDTLVLWGGEFGRTPTVQVARGEAGRDHHTEGFTMWMAGGGVKGGYRYGATDEYGYYAIENRCTIHDLHATILHLLGLDHMRLTYPHAGRDFRLTDVYGEVAKGIIA
jgi:hypothetical protein